MTSFTCGRALSLLHPDLFATVLGPKVQELTASPERFEGDTAKAKAHFEHGFRKAFVALKQKNGSSVSSHSLLRL